MPVPSTPNLSRQRIHDSHLFDEPWYRANYATHLSDDACALDHYDTIGWALGFDPNPFFDSHYYLANLIGEATSEVGDPLLHYITIGAAQGRRPSRAFDPVYYLSTNPDVANSGMEPLAHFLVSGHKEGRAPRHADRGHMVSGGAASQRTRPFDAYFGYEDLGQATPVSYVSQRPVGAPVVRTIAFYLPQFHPIEENDRWWGKGFTEWTNVTRARPQFDGHYQPHLPGEMGYYDLRRPEIQHRQAELAQEYGISAFCMYFYWFGGKRLLEQPILQFANDPDIDLPFCLCWANENWTRRWDGLDQEVLISQKHSNEDDVAFIEYISIYLKNPRYLRIEGKPVLLIYRPKLIPDMAATAARWREWCRNNGVGEIYLACTQSFSAEDPREFGLDAAVEFPPINAKPWTGELPRLLNPDFAGRLLDWGRFVDDSAQYAPSEYPIFRTVCPSWDNEARRSGKGAVLMGASPERYITWLENAAIETVERSVSRDERIVFVNAWNEWAEGAHLEPDRRHGYAYLESHRMALTRAKARVKGIFGAVPERRVETRGLAAVIHAFYPDVFENMLMNMRGNALIERYYVTSIADNVSELHDICTRYRLDYEIIEVDNHGRDVLPFLKALRRVRNDGFRYLLKLHTKKSLHRSDGDTWRDEIYEMLGNPEQSFWILRELEAQPDVGIVAPAGHVLAQGAFLGSNEARLRNLIGRMGCDSRRNLDRDPLVSGTMFYARIAAMEPLADLSLADDDFEKERGQVDGTLAHAMERAVSYSAMAANFTVRSAPMARNGSEQRFRNDVLDGYRFARNG